MAFPASAEEVRETLRRIQKNLECPICLELLSDPYSTQCSHPFCRSCIYMVISSSKEARCPLCKEPISKRSMNENARLADIVEAVKSLEQAIIKDSGIQSTPPRPLHQHSREATGTPGLILHSLLHPTPQKPALAEASLGLERRHTEMEGRGPTTISSGAHGDSGLPAASRGGWKPGLCPNRDLEKKYFNPSRKRVRFAGVRSSKRMPGSGRASSGVDPAALLRALEEADFAEPEHHGMISDPDLEQRSGYGTNSSCNTASSSVNSTANGGDQFGGSSTNPAIPSPEPHGEHCQRKKTLPLSTYSPASQKPRTEPQPVPAQQSGYQAADINPLKTNRRQPPSGMCENLTVVQETPFLANTSNHPSSDNFHGNNISESPWLDPSALGNHAGSSWRLDSAGESVLVAITPVSATAAIAEETQPLRRCTSERLAEEDLSDDILAKESQFTDDPMDTSAPVVNTRERTAPETQTVEETQMNTLPTSASVGASGATGATSSSGRQQCSDDAIEHEGSNQSTSQDAQSVRAPEGIVSLPSMEEAPEGVVSLPSMEEAPEGIVSLPSMEEAPEGIVSLPSMEEVNSREEEGDVSRSGDSTQSLSPPAFVRETPFRNTPPTFMSQTPFRKTPPTARTYSSSRSKEDLNSTGSTTPDLKELQGSTAVSPSEHISVSVETHEEVPICSSPKSTTVPICRPCFTSPPPHGRLATPSPSLNHSISPSIPLQNQYQSMGSCQERVVIPDTFPNSIPPSLKQKSSDSVPSSQQSPVVAIHSPALPGLFPRTSITSGVAEDPGPVSSLSLAERDMISRGAPLAPLPATRDMIPAGVCSGPSSTHHSVSVMSSPSSTHHNAGVMTSPSSTHLSDSVMTSPNSDKLSSPAVLTLSGSVPNSVTIIPDSLHPHSPDHISANPDTIPTPTTPHTPGNDHPSPVPSSTSLSEEMRSLDSDAHNTFTSAYTQWDSSCKSYLSQGLTSQEVEALRAQMEEKQREIQELEALLLAKSTKAAGDEDKDRPERDTVGPSISDCSCHSELTATQTSNRQEPCGSHAHKDDHTPTPTQHSLSSAEVTVVAETIPDSLPLCNTLGPGHPTESNSAVSCNSDRTCSQVEHELAKESAVPPPGSNQKSNPARRCNRSDMDEQESAEKSATMQTTSVGRPISENVGSSPPSRIPVDTDQQQTKTKLLLQRADDLIRAFQCPPSGDGSQSGSQAPRNKAPECSRPLVTGPHTTPLLNSGKAISRRKRKIGSLEHGQKNTSPMNVPPKRTKKSLIDQFVTRPSPAATKSSVLQAADRLLKALRNPPKIVLESQTTMEVDAALVGSTSKARSHTSERRENVRSSGSKMTPKSLLRQSKDGLPAATKRRAPLVVLDSQDVETYSPPPLDGPLPEDHPFLSISTSKHQQASVVNAGATTTPGCQSNPFHFRSPQKLIPLNGCQRSGTTPTSKPSGDGGGGGPSVMVTPRVQLSGGTTVAPGGSYAERLKSGLQTPSFVGSGLSKAQLKQAQLLAKTHGGRIASCFNGSTTHVIVLTDENGCCPRTVKYLQGVAAGRWIVSYEWIKDSLEAGQLLPERDHEALGDHLSGRGSNAPLRARSSLAAGEPGLFNMHNFLLVGHFTATSSDYLSQLVQLGGGRVVASMDGFLPPVDQLLARAHLYQRPPLAGPPLAATTSSRATFSNYPPVATSAVALTASSPSRFPVVY